MSRPAVASGRMNRCHRYTMMSHGRGSCRSTPDARSKIMQAKPRSWAAMNIAKSDRQMGAVLKGRRRRSPHRHHRMSKEIRVQRMSQNRIKLSQSIGTAAWHGLPARGTLTWASCPCHIVNMGKMPMPHPSSLTGGGRPVSLVPVCWPGVPSVWRETTAFRSRSTVQAGQLGVKSVVRTTRTGAVDVGAAFAGIP